MGIVERLNILREERNKKLNANPLYIKEYKLKYITGTSAFNIPYNGMQCDWHQIDTLKAGREGRFIMHPSVIIGAEDIFGEYGIWDCNEWLEGRGFGENTYLCATPNRAILDILYNWIVIKEKYPQSLDDFWDFMFDELDMNELLNMLDKLQNYLNAQQKDWLMAWRENNEI